MTELEYWTKKKDIEITPELKERFEKLLELILTDEVKQFVSIIVMKESSQGRVEDAVNACETAFDYLKATNMASKFHQSRAVEFVVAAILLHNVYFTRVYDKEANAAPEDFWLDVYELRYQTQKLADFFVHQNTQLYGIFDIIYEYVEAQLGELMPVRGSRPVRGQDTHLTWEVLWLYYTQVRPLQEKLKAAECSTK